MTAALRLEFLENIALVTFDQPGSRANTLGQAIIGELEALLADLRRRTDLTGLVFRSGKPGMFIAGADIKELGGACTDEAAARFPIKRGLDTIAAFEALPFPTVAAIDGSCLGGGLELAMGFDYRIAGSHPKVELGLPETKLGIIPGWGGTQRLTRLIGPSLAAEMICAGESAKADRARQMGLVFDAVPVERLQEEAVRLLQWARQTGEWQTARKRKQQ